MNRVSLYLSQSVYVLLVLDDQSAKAVRRYRFILTTLIALDMGSRHMFLATDSKPQILGCGVVIFSHLFPLYSDYSYLFIRKTNVDFTLKSCA